jgi:hypothetical protein
MLRAMINKLVAIWCSVVHNGRMSTNTSPPSIRLTIPVDAETHAIFQRLAKAGNMSTGRAMGEWLRDTVEAAELMASTMERARAAPKVVTAELHAMILGMADQTKELQDKYAKFKGSMADGASGGKRSATVAAAGTVPPSCNTGGKVPEQGKRSTGGKRVSSIGKIPLPPAKVQAYADTNGIPPKVSK